MLPKELAQNFELLVAPLIQSMQLELVAITVRPQGRTNVIEILADRPQGGITVDECAAINRFVVNEIEQRKLIEDFIVEVSSPGLDRPLRTAKDFSRVIGRSVWFFLGGPVGNKREHEGVVQKIQDEDVLVNTKSGTISIPLNKINKAIQII